VPFSPPEALSPERLAQVIADSKVTSADVDAYWRSRRIQFVSEVAGPSPTGASGPLGLSPIPQVVRGCISGGCIVGRVTESSTIAWAAAAGAWASPVEYPEPSPAPVEQLPGDVVIDKAEVRGRRARNTLRAQASLITARLAADPFRWRLAFLTLTYADGQIWEPGDITHCVDCMRLWARRRGYALPRLWCLELGGAGGRLHYHVVFWLRKGETMPKPDKQGWWTKGATRIEWAKHQAAAPAYLAKYMTKPLRRPSEDEDLPCDGLHEIPPGARLHGAGGLTLVERCRMAWGRAPAWVREHWPSWEDEPRPAPGGGWVSRVTGEWKASPWVFVGLTMQGFVLIRPFCQTIV
jgi:hypothetical protein